LSTLLPKGFLPGLDGEVFLSLPCACGQEGVTDVVRMKLTQGEIEQMKNSANVLMNLTKEIHL
jgi:L-lactate dehydrogenase